MSQRVQRVAHRLHHVGLQADRSQQMQEPTGMRRGLDDGATQAFGLGEYVQRLVVMGWQWSVRGQHDNGRYSAIRLRVM